MIEINSYFLVTFLSIHDNGIATLTGWGGLACLLLLCSRTRAMQIFLPTHTRRAPFNLNTLPRKIAARPRLYRFRSPFFFLFFFSRERKLV